MRLDKSRQIERTASGAARGSDSLDRRRVALIRFSQPSEAVMFHELDIIHQFCHSDR